MVYAFPAIQVSDPHHRAAAAAVELRDQLLQNESSQGRATGVADRGFQGAERVTRLQHI
jgi:hypothetical protein